MLKKDKARLFWRYFLPFGIVMVLLILLSLFCCYRYAETTVKREVEEEISAFADDALSFFDNQFQEMDRIAYCVRSKESLRPYSVFNGAAIHTIANDEMAAFVSGNTYLDDVLLFYGDSIAQKFGKKAVIVSSLGISDAKTIWNYLYNFQSLSYDELITYADAGLSVTVPNVQSKSFYPGGGRYIVYTLTNGQDSLIVFLLNLNKVEGYFKEKLERYDGKLLVWDANDTLLAEIGNGTDKTIDNDGDAAPDPDTENTVNVTKESAQVYMKDALRGIRLYMRWDENIYADFFMVAMKAQIPMVLSISLGIIILLIAVSRMSFRPFEKVYDSVVTYSKPLTVSFEGLARSIKDIEERWDNVQLQMEKQKRLCRLQVISTILTKHLNETDIRHLLTDNNIVMQGKYYVVSMYHAVFREDKEYYSIKDTFCDYIEKLSGQNNVSLFAIAVDENGKYVCISVFDELPDLSEYYTNMQTVLKAGLSEKSMLTTGYSEPVSSLSELPMAYSQAETALQYEFVFGEGSVISIEQIISVSADRMVWYPVQQEEMLIQALNVSDASVAGECLDTMERILRDMRTYPQVFRSIMSSVIRRMASTASERNSLYEAELIRVDQMLNGNSINLHDVIEKLKSIVSGLCEASDKSTENSADTLCGKVDEYLDASLKDDSLSLDSIAEAFGISSRYLTKIYKEQKGITVVQALDNKRMELAEHLVKDTDLSLADICTECGFTDKGNFIRKFKKNFQTTPMHYRELYRTR